MVTTRTLMDAVNAGAANIDPRLDALEGDVSGLTTSVGDLASDVNDLQSSKVGGNGSITTVVQLTQAAYDALGTKDANTLYVIVG